MEKIEEEDDEPSLSLRVVCFLQLVDKSTRRWQQTLGSPLSFASYGESTGRWQGALCLSLGARRHLLQPINKDTRRHQQAKGLLLFSMTIKKMKRQGALSLSLSSTPYGKNIRRWQRGGGSSLFSRATKKKKEKMMMSPTHYHLML